MTKYFITGAAGSLGSALVNMLAGSIDNVVRAFDIDEYGLSTLPGNVRKIHGSVTDMERVHRAMTGCDVVIHCAAMKNLGIAEYNIESLVEINISGTMNVALAARTENIPVAIFISSDKAVTGHSIYGSTKYVGEKIWRYAHRTSKGTKFITLRSGNFCTSRGNVFEVWDKQARDGGPLTITSPDMRRYFIKTEKVALIIRQVSSRALLSTQIPGGSVIIPRMQEYGIMDLLNLYHPGAETRIIGLREGESIREELLCRDEEVVEQNPSYTVARS